MALWLVRAGKLGEYENKFLTDKRVYLTWDNLNTDLNKLTEWKSLINHLGDLYENDKPKTIQNWASQIMVFARDFQKGDWIVLPSKMKSVIHFGEVTGDYVFDTKAENPLFHYRSVKWFATDIPRSNFDQDILYSFGAFLTVCRITRNNAEERVKQMYQNGWKTTNKISLSDSPIKGMPDIESDTLRNFEELTNDQIAKYIDRKFKGDKMEVLIRAILEAKGYITYQSPKGRDKTIDILAAPEPMGFGTPRLLVQVKSGDTPVDRPTLDQLIGAMQNVHATQGLLVSWSSFKKTVEDEIPNQFFRVRLWGQKEIIHELLDNYDKLDATIKAELPLKRIWTLSLSDE